MNNDIRLYCGNTSFEISQIIKRNILNNVFSWLNGEKIVYFHKGRTAIRYICDILKVHNGDEILVPSYNCGSEVDALMSSGASIVLYKINNLLQIDLNDIIQKITSKTKIIYIIHYFGFPHQIEEIKIICKDRGIFLFEDCALCLFSRNNGTNIGSSGDISVFSFPKSLPVPDGGAIIINNPRLNQKSYRFSYPSIWKILNKMLPLIKGYILRKSPTIGRIIFLGINLFRKRNMNLKLSADDSADYPDMPADYYYNEKLTNKKISYISKFLLKSFNYSEIIQKRRHNFNKYLDAFKHYENVKLLYNNLPEGICPLNFPIIVEKRNYLYNILNNFSISAIPWWAGFHKLLPWSEYPDACYLKNNLLALPVHHQLDDIHIKYIIKSFIGITQRK